MFCTLRKLSQGFIQKFPAFNLNQIYSALINATAKKKSAALISAKKIDFNSMQKATAFQA